jgi:hypothetical protein
MRKSSALFVACALLLGWASVAWSGGDTGRAIVAKAVKAAGGQANIAKFQSGTWKEKGTYYGMGDGLPYTGVYAMQAPEKFRMEIKGVFVKILNGKKGWTIAGGKAQEMKKAEVESEQVNQRAGFVASLVPLKDKAFQIKATGSAKVKGKEASGVEVSRKDYPTVKLYFDKKTSLLAMSAYKVKDAEQNFKEVLMEVYFDDYRDLDGAKVAHKFVLNRDGKKFVEAEMMEIKGTKKLDAKLFAPPAK